MKTFAVFLLLYMLYGITAEGLDVSGFGSGDDNMTGSGNCSLENNSAPLLSKATTTLEIMLTPSTFSNMITSLSSTIAPISLSEMSQMTVSSVQTATMTTVIQSPTNLLDGSGSADVPSMLTMMTGISSTTSTTSTSNTPFLDKLLEGSNVYYIIGGGCGVLLFCYILFCWCCTCIYCKKSRKRKQTYTFKVTEYVLEEDAGFTKRISQDVESAHDRDKQNKSEDVVTTFGLTTVIEKKNEEDGEKITNIDTVTKEEMDDGKEVISVIKSDVNDGKKEHDETKQVDGKETKTVKSEDERSSGNKDLGKNKEDGGHDEQKEVANTEASSVKIDSTTPHEIINIEEHKEDMKKEAKTKIDEDKKNGTKGDKQDTKSPEKEDTKEKGPVLDSSTTAPTTNGDSLDNLMKTVLDFSGSLTDDGNDIVTEL